MGIVVLDQERRIDTCLGALVGSIAHGCLASEALPFLTGLDDVIEEIVSGQRSSFSLPRVTLQEGCLADKILSLEILPSDARESVQILVRDETELGDLEQRVLQQRNELSLTHQALEEAKERAEEALREKAAFLANVSHDLKTPLQVIIGNAEILRGNLPAEEREAFLQDVLDNSNFLLSLITDLLDASALEADQMKLTEDVVDINAMLGRILSMARQLPNGKERHFDLSVENGAREVLADPMRLQRLLLNVLSNAVKFTESGGHIAVKAGSEEEGGLVIEIEDDGCGIDSEMIAHVFEPFTRIGTSEGAGLGLHIARGLAELHEADLSLSSDPGAGTKARLRIPKSRIVATKA